MQTTDLLFVRQAYEVTLGQPYPLKQLSPKRVLFPIPGRWHHVSTKAGVLNISPRCLASDRFRIDSSDAVTVCGTPLVFPAGLFRCGCCFRCCMCLCPFVVLYPLLGTPVQFPISRNLLSVPPSDVKKITSSTDQTYS